MDICTQIILRSHQIFGLIVSRACTSVRIVATGNDAGMVMHDMVPHRDLVAWRVGQTNPELADSGRYDHCNRLNVRFFPFSEGPRFVERNMEASAK